MSKSNLYDFRAILVHETEKAVLLEHGGEAPTWLPKSMCEIEYNEGGKTVTVTCDQGVAEEKGFV
jgi:hypothetical protein